MKLGKSIRYLRVNKARQIQGLFAYKIGVTQSYLSQIENDKKEASTEVLQKIADVLGIPLPIIFWYAVTEDDINPEKLEAFRLLKPSIDTMIQTII